MSKYKPYPKYKESGVAWLGEVPEGWKVAGFKKYFENIVDYRGKTPEKVDNGIFLVTARNIKSGRINYNLSSEYVKVEDYNNIMSRGKPEISDVLFTTEAPLGEVANIDNINIALAQRVIKFRGKKNILDNYYLKYFMMSSNFQSSLMIFATGSTALGIKAERLVYLRQLIPSLTEQKNIATYLDQKTQKIDSLIEKQQTLIKLLKEKRQALISHAVTKGLDDDISDWQIKKVKFNLTLQNKKVTIDKQEVIALENIESKSGKYIKTESSYKGEDVAFQKGDILFGKLRPYLSKVFECKNDGVAFGDLLVFRPNREMDSTFVFYSMLSDKFIAVVDSSTYGTKMPRASVEFINEMPMSTPPLKEQKNIAQYLDQKTKQIDTLISKSTQAIELLKERRSALISAVVTGKVDVREDY